LNYWSFEGLHFSASCFSPCFYGVPCSYVVEWLIGDFNHLLSSPWLNCYAMTGLIIARLKCYICSLTRWW
jgi:hypothetical protein